MTFHCIDDHFKITLIKYRSRNFFNAKVCDNDIVINGKPLYLHNFLSTGKRAAINDNPPVCCCSYSHEFFDGPTNTCKTRSASESFICQAAGRSV